MAIFSYEADLVDVPELEMELADSRCTVLEGELVDNGTQVLTAELTTKTELVNYDDAELRQMIGEKADVTALNDYYSKAVVDAKLAQAGKVKSVNGRTGEVTLTCEDVGAASAQAMAAVSQRVEGKYGPDVPPPYPVTSINGQTGDVVVLGVGEQYVTPQQFGAVGDGAADDTAAVQAAINSGKPVFFPVGRYRVTRPLTCNQNTLVLLGQHGGGGVRATLDTSTTANYEKVFSILYEDFSVNGTLLDLSNRNAGFCFVCKGLVFMSYKYDMSISTANRNETRSEIITNGLAVPSCRAWLSDCFFFGFSGFGLMNSNPSSDLRNISLYRCYIGAILYSYNNTLTDFWVSCCHTGIRFEAAINYNSFQKMRGCWFEQMYTNAVESTSAVRILFSDISVDMVGGCAYENLSYLGETIGYYTGRISRTNIFEGNGALSGRTFTRFYLQTDGADVHNGYTNKSLVYFSGNFIGNTVIAPGQTNILYRMTNQFNLINSMNSFVNVPYSNTSRTQSIVGGLIIVTTLPTSGVIMGQMALVRAAGAETGKLYVCTGTNPVAWVQVTE